MSEFQYYEFQAIDRPLSAKDMAELRKCSTRGQITSTSFKNTYNWGDLKADPAVWVARYFDAFLYVADWGTRRLMLRLPARLVAEDAIAPYADCEAVSHWIVGDNVIFDIEVNYEDWDIIEADDWLAALLPLRMDLMHGDFRCLYLAWLVAAENDYEVEDDDLEPPVPPGLNDLTPALRAFAEFFEIDADLLGIAAEASGTDILSGPTDDFVAAWVSALPEDEKNAILISIINEEDAHAGVALRQRILTAHAVDRPGSTPGPAHRRTADQLLAQARAKSQARRREEEEKQARAQAAALKRRLDSLLGREDQAWARVETSANSMQQLEYDKALVLIGDLWALAQREDTQASFASRLDAFRATHARRSSLMRRLSEAGL